MYCSSCGTRFQSELIYCNRCGKRVKRDDGEANKVATTLSQVLGAICGFGIIGFVLVILILVNNGVTQSSLARIAFFYFAALFGICALIMQQISALSKNAPATKEAVSSNMPQPAYLKPVTTAQLIENGGRPISITEHATRTLDEIQVLRK
ncbi:MAG: hypothetical protein ACT4O9_17815 [Blastocatellia bacterium]